MNKHRIIPIFVPHLGCPHDCVFCNQRKITNWDSDITATDVENTINTYLEYFSSDSFIEIAFYGGSFTAIKLDIQIELLSVALRYKREGIINEIRLSTRPDAINDEILKHLDTYEVDTIELGVQSLDEEVLMASGRGHTSTDVYKAVELIRLYGFKLGLQMMIGLPKDSREKDLYTAMEFIRLKPDCVRIYPTLVIKGTFLEKLEEKNIYKPLTLLEAVEVVTPIMMMFYLNNINVIRVGLQPTDNIQLGKDVVSGPFHPSFRQLVESNIYKCLLDNYFDNNKLDYQNKVLEIGMNIKEISDFSGQGSSNIKYLTHKYKFKKIKVKNINIDPRYFTIKVDSFYDRIDMVASMKLNLSDVLQGNKINYI